jgi:hypothetical protein
LLLESLQLDAPRPQVVEGLRGPEEEVDGRADVGQREPEQRGQEDEEGVADPPAGVSARPVGEAEPEHDGDDHGEVPRDDEAGGVGRGRAGS